MSHQKNILLSRNRPKKPIRMLSGVHVVTVAMMPSDCPHGRCVYCPGGVEHGTPQSYILESPVVKKALPLAYHPYYQVNSRLTDYAMMGHSPSKIELIIVGGTFPAYQQAYQEWFVAQCFEALNRFPDTIPPTRTSIREAQTTNETGNFRCIGLTVETRPDRAKQEEANMMLAYGATRVELGVQTVFNDILRKAGRAHSIEDVEKATKTLKDSGFKVCYHMMLGLPGMNPQLELEAFERIFGDPSLRPDMIKIYPTLVLRETALYQMWKNGRYKAYSDDEVIEIVAEIKKKVPRWVRINRMQREIPSHSIVAGLTTVNLRELARRRLSYEGMDCKCIRCREIGLAEATTKLPIEHCNFTLTREEYGASDGSEVFLSYEDQSRKLLAGFLRLRIPSRSAPLGEFRSATAIVRELHVYGSAVPVGSRDEGSTQHRGVGSCLLEAAEDIAAAEYDCRQIAVISGVGVREYYRMRGYSKNDRCPYMLKACA